MRYVLLFSLVLAYAFTPVTSKAGTFMAGAKYWDASWDSAILDWFEKDTAGGFKTLGVELKSDIGTEPYSYEQRAEDAYKLIKHLGLEKVTVIGFSDGGFAAYKLAAIYPEVVEKIVAMGAGDDPPKDEPGSSSYSADSLMKNYGDFFKSQNVLSFGVKL